MPHRTSRLLLALFALVFLGLPARAADPALDAATRTANAVATATLAGDFEKVIDLTYDTIVQAMGGRDTAVKVSKSAFDQMKAVGMTITSLKIGDPGDAMVEGGKTFVIIPTSLEVRDAKNKQKMLSTSYLLGISEDAGKTWKFIEGSGLADAQLREKVLPRLPPAMKLPERKDPQVLKD